MAPEATKAKIRGLIINEASGFYLALLFNADLFANAHIFVYHRFGDERYKCY